MTDIEKIVLRRVRTVRALQALLSGVTFSVFFFALALWGIGREVWVAKVFENMPSGNLGALGVFYAHAFLHTEIFVQILTLASLASLAYLAHKTARLISRPLFAQPV